MVSSIIVSPSFANTIVRQQRFDQAPNRGFDALARAAGIYLADAIRLGGRDGLIAVGNAFEERAIGFLDAVAHKLQSGLAGKQAFGAGMMRNDHKNGKIGARVL